MIDYHQMVIKHSHKPLPAGYVLELSPEGDEKWCVRKALDVLGSYEDKIRIRSQGAYDPMTGDIDELFISGNPSKFLQGHNIFGSTDLIGLTESVLERVGESVDIGTVAMEAITSARLSRIDFTRSIQFENEQQAKAYIRQHSLHAKSRSGRGNLIGYTLTFQKGSRRWSLVMYHKGEEVKKHELPHSLPVSQLQAEADKLVRVELRLLGNELSELNLRTLGHCTAERLNAVYEEYLMKIELNAAIEIPTDEIMLMQRCIRDTYQMWKLGIDVTQMMTTPTLYRHQNLLKGYGINIFIPCEANHIAKVLPMTKILTGQAYQIPQWALDQGLVFQRKVA